MLNNEVRKQKSASFRVQRREEGGEAPQWNETTE